MPGRGLDDGLARGSACSTNGGSLLVEQRERGTSVRVVETPEPICPKRWVSTTASPRGSACSTNGRSLLVEQRERGTSDRVVETPVTDTLIVGSSSSRRRDAAASTGAVKGSLRRFAPLTAPAPAGDGAYRDDADLWSGGHRWSSSGSEGRATALSRPLWLARLGTRDRFGVSTTASPRGSACSTNWRGSLVEQRARDERPRRRDLGADLPKEMGLDDGLAQGLGLLDQREVVGRAAGARDERPRCRDLRSLHGYVPGIGSVVSTTASPRGSACSTNGRTRWLRLRNPCSRAGKSLPDRDQWVGG